MTALAAVETPSPAPALVPSHTVLLSHSLALPGGRPRSLRSRRSGFALVDICVSLVILAIAMGVLVGSVFSAMRISQANAATATANQAMRGVLETLCSMPIESVFAICNEDSSDDLVGMSAGDYLQIPEAMMSDAHGDPITATITFPTKAGFPGVLQEDLVLPELGMPRDINGDGEVDSADHSGDFVLLPVLLTLEWQGPSGTQKVQMATLLRNE